MNKSKRVTTLARVPVSSNLALSILLAAPSNDRVYRHPSSQDTDCERMALGCLHRRNLILGAVVRWWMQ